MTDYDDDWGDDGYAPEPDWDDGYSDYYERLEPEMGSYDDQFTQHERARVEALRMLAGQGRPIDEMIAEASCLAECILGPEATAPDPYPAIREAWDKVQELLTKASDTGNPWDGMAYDVEVTVKIGDLRAIRNTLDGITNPF